MFKNKLRGNTLWKNSLWQAPLVVGLFFFLAHFSDKNIIRENVGDIAFDVVNKLVISTQEQASNAKNKANVTVFAFDTEFMKENGLVDEDGYTRYGYSFPREIIAAFINQLDQYLINKESYCPKALFIDFDLSYTTGEDTNVSVGDQILIDTLTRPRCYNILLSKSNPDHYIEQAAKKNPVLQRLIDQQAIAFVSPYFHQGDDNVIRRYEPTKTIGSDVYPAAAIALWQLHKNNRIDLEQAQHFIDHVKHATSPDNKEQRLNVNANRVWVKHYKETTGCMQRSYWNNLTKYSVLCAFDTLSQFKLKNGLLLLGGTEAGEDEQKVLNLIKDEKMSGVDLHANTLMTLLHLDQNKQDKLPLMQQLPLKTSLFIVFVSFVLLNLLSAWLIYRWNMSNNIITFSTALVVNSLVLFFISLYFLQAANAYWFNWIVPLILFQLMEVIMIIGKVLTGTCRCVFQRKTTKPLTKK